MNGRRPFDHPRARGTNPRAKAENPRARGTNPVPGKSESRGQWRAAWRRLDRMTPVRRHELLCELERLATNTPGGHSAEAGELLLELKRRRPIL